MTSEEKNQFDAIAALWKGAWEQFNERRRFEFQISLAVWTALASFIALVISKDGTFNESVLIGTWICAILIFLIYVLWTLGLYRANTFEKRIAFHYADKLRKLSDSEFDRNLKQDLDNSQKSKMRFWSQAVQIGITFVLSVAAIVSVISKA